MLERWIARHWIALITGCLLMGIAIRVAYNERGYAAVGSEWLIIPVVFFIEHIIRNKREEERRRCRNMRRYGKNVKNREAR